jgi:hypothetical protein
MASASSRLGAVPHSDLPTQLPTCLIRMKQSVLINVAWRTAALLVVSFGASAGETEIDPYQQRIQPFIEKHCVRCHSEAKASGELNLARYTQARQVAGDFRRWEHVIEFIRKGEMPPADEPQPTLQDRQTVTAALEAILLEEAKKQAGDPGAILPRRLSNTEYDLSIRDLTGVDIRPTQDFPVDPAGGEGFDNTGEALGMSPSLLKKYLGAAQHVSEHLVLKTSGLTFAPFPVTSTNEQKKLTEQAIIDFYERHKVRLADYLEAAWRYRHRSETDRGLSLAEWAERKGLSPKYLTLLGETLQEASAGTGYLQQIGQLWDALPAPNERAGRPRELEAVERLILFAQRQLGFREEALIRSHAGNWPIAHLEFRALTARQRDQFDPGNFKSERTVRFERLPNRKGQAAEGYTLYLKIERAFDDGEGGRVLIRRPMFTKGNALPRNDEEARKQEAVSLRDILEKDHPELAERLSFGKRPDGTALDADTFLLQAPALVEIPLTAERLRELEGKQLVFDCQLDPSQHERSVHVYATSRRPPEESDAANAELLLPGDSELAKKLAKSAEIFCRTFPNRFFYVDSERGLAAGFHLVEGFFRDDLPLVEKVLSAAEQRELDQLWQELEFVTQSTETLLRGFVWFERAERHVLHDARFDFLRSEDPRLVEDELLARFERVYLEKMGVKLAEGAIEPLQPNKQFNLIHGFFEQIREGLARQRRQLQVAEKKGLADLQTLAERAYRRPLRKQEAESLVSLYRRLRQRGQSVEGALRSAFAAVLMSPEFFFHYHDAPPGAEISPLPDYALASRLSYFLWSSLPDEELLAAARDGKLQDEKTLVAQLRRMLADPKTAAFAREFFGQWLRYRDYLEKDAIHAEAFPGYTDELREAMFEEPVRLATHLIQTDQPITRLLNSDVTFVNGVLAKHYGGEIAQQYQSQSADPTAWRKVEGLRGQGRGGLLGMGVVLTKTSKSERTSPIKRGFWAVHHLLGQHFPPPPLDIAELPPNEKQASKTIRQLITEHTANPKCAMCHVHFDSLGMALEGFDPIGRARTHDLAGRPVDDVAILPSGKTAKGIPGLIEYLQEHRRQDFVRTFCRKFLGYALGRSVVLSDQPLLNEMEAALEKNDQRFSVLFETVVRSPQFRRQRGGALVADHQ